MRKKLFALFTVLSLSIACFCGPTKEQFIRTCDSLNIHHAEVVWAQARLESGNFTSAHFKNRNNCLGIYDSRNKRYALFESWIHCLIAYRDKVQYRCKTPECTNEEYIKWLVNIGYASDASYAEKIKSMMK